VLRFGLEALRGDRRPHVLGLSVNRWMCLTEIAVALAIDARPIDAHDAAIAAFLASTLVVCIAGRRALDDRRRLLAPPHLEELRRIVAAPTGSEVRSATTSRGVSIAVSHEGALHVSLSLPRRPRDLSLLCELAAHALPALDPQSGVVSGRTLHVHGGAGGSADELYGNVVRALQAPRRADPRAYFSRRAA
jgi:hypothetical protein